VLFPIFMDSDYPVGMALFRKTEGGFFVAPGAVVVGDVTVGELSSFWFGAVVRGDVAPVIIGRRVNVQDGAVIHCDTDVSNTIGDDVTIGHRAVVHGVSVGAGTLIGMGAVVLGGTRIGRECLVAAGAVVPPGLVVPDRMLVIGVPGKIARPVREKDLAYMKWLTAHYVELAERYTREEDVRPAASSSPPS
jgi:carbonic anhydrase/acetyltransferase-like protein (isoleucine patch superfamily)